MLAGETAGRGFLLTAAFLDDDSNSHNCRSEKVISSLLNAPLMIISLKITGKAVRVRSG